MRFLKPKVIWGCMYVSVVLVLGGLATAQTAQSQSGGAVEEVLRRAGVSPTPTVIVGTSEKETVGALDRIEGTYQLPRSVLDTTDRQPDDPAAVMRQLNLKPSPGERVDFRQRGRTPTSQDFLEVLKPQ